MSKKKTFGCQYTRAEFDSMLKWMRTASEEVLLDAVKQVQKKFDIAEYKRK